MTLKNPLRTIFLFSVEWKKAMLYASLIILSSCIIIYAQANKEQVKKETNKLLILKDINIRTSTNINMKPFTYVVAGDEYTIIDIVPRWYQVNIISGQEEHIGKLVWLHSSKLFVEDGIVTVLDKGMTMRSSPEMNPDNVMGFIISGAKGGVVDFTARWYKINRNIDSPWKHGWINNYKGYVRRK